MLVFFDGVLIVHEAFEHGKTRTEFSRLDAVRREMRVDGELR
jgi:hypothetical protein